MKEPMDGPRLSQDLSSGSIFCSKLETAYYNKISPPDLIFVLQVSIQELRKRKTDLELSTHCIKASAVNAIKADSNKVLVNANQNYSDVLLTLQKSIFESF